VKYVDFLVLLAKEETALQGTSDRLMEARISKGMEIDAEKLR
jgi:hypothetical protein